MRKRMHCIIAILNIVGHPDIFLTMACKLNWPEITRSIFPGQTSVNHPDLFVSVFRIKMRAVTSCLID